MSHRSKYGKSHRKLDRPDKLPSLVLQAEPGEQPGVLAHTDSVRRGGR